MKEEDVKAVLTAKGLSISITYKYSSSPKGTVLDQSIESGSKVSKGTKVTITVSSGEETVSVANVVGKKKSDAQEILKNSGLKVTINNIYSDSAAKDVVISQSPDAGTSQTKGTTIVLTVSLGKDTIQSISVKSQPNKTTYFIGEMLDPAGLTLNANYKSGKSVIITGGYSCSPEKLNTEGTQTVTVSYEEMTTTFKVTVKEVSLDSISLKSKPNKTTYYKGETLDTTGLQLTAKYSDGSSEIVTGGFSCSPTTLNNTGTQNIKVTYYGKEVSFTVTVNELELSSIAVKKMPSKTQYYVGDKLDVSGLTLTATYNNGNNETIVDGFSCSPTTLNSAGSQKIKVTYNGKETSFSVTVSEVEVSSISVKTMPNKTQYYQGSSLDTSGLSLTITYSNKVTETVSDGFDYSPKVLDKMGSQTITITYLGEKTTFAVEVKDNEWSEWVTELPESINSDNHEIEEKTQYRYCDKLDSGEYGEWSDWQFEKVSSSSTRQVETRVVSRKIYHVVNQTHYHCHPKWSTYQDTKVVEDDDTVVSTRKVYRYRHKVK